VIAVPATLAPPLPAVCWKSVTLCPETLVPGGHTSTPNASAVSPAWTKRGTALKPTRQCFALSACPRACRWWLLARAPDGANATDKATTARAEVSLIERICAPPLGSSCGFAASCDCASPNTSASYLPAPKHALQAI